MALREVSTAGALWRVRLGRVPTATWRALNGSLEFVCQTHAHVCMLHSMRLLVCTVHGRLPCVLPHAGCAFHLILRTLPGHACQISLCQLLSNFMLATFIHFYHMCCVCCIRCSISRVSSIVLHCWEARKDSLQHCTHTHHTG